MHVAWVISGSRLEAETEFSGFSATCEKGPLCFLETFFLLDVSHSDLLWVKMLTYDPGTPPTSLTQS